MQEGTSLAYFYFDYRQQGSQTPGCFIADILRQLTGQLDIFPDFLRELYERYKLEEARLLELELLNALQEIVKLFKRCFIVIDAFDECVDGDCRHKILQTLSSLDSAKLQIFLTSRPHPIEIGKLFQSALHETITASESDLKTYCHQVIECSQNMRNLLHADLEEEIVETVASKAQGM